MTMPRAATIALLLVAACAPARRDERVEIRFWAMGREGEVVQELVPEFERRNPTIRVRVQQMPWTAAHEKLLTAFVGNAMPDLCQLGNTWIPEFVALRALEPLDSLIGSSAVVAPAAFFPGIWETNRMDSTTYGIPWYVDTRLIFYNTDALRRAGFDHPPKSWAEWLAAMTKIKAQVGKDRYAVLMPTNEWAQPTILGLQAGSPLLRDGGRYGAFRDSTFREAFTFYVNLFKADLAPPVSDRGTSNLYQDFERGYFAMYISGPWNIGEFRRRLPAAMQDKWMTMPMPSVRGDVPGASLAGGSSLAVFRRSAHKAEAWKFIEFLSEPAQQIKFYQLTGDLPASTAAWQTPELADNKYARAFFEQLQHVQPMPMVPEWERIATKMAEYAQQAIAGQQTVEQALAGLDRDVDRMLEKRRWLLARK